MVQKNVVTEHVRNAVQDQKHEKDLYVYSFDDIHSFELAASA